MITIQIDRHKMYVLKHLKAYGNMPHAKVWHLNLLD